MSGGEILKWQKINNIFVFIRPLVMAGRKNTFYVFNMLA